MIPLLCFLICAGIVVSCFRRGSDVFSPARVFGFVWCAAVGLADLKLSQLQHEWSFVVWIIILLGPASSLLGMYIVYVCTLRDEVVSIDRMRDVLIHQAVNERRLFLSIVAAFFIYMVSYTVIYAVKGYIPMFSMEGILSRTEFGLFGLGLFLHSMPFIIFCTVVYHLTVKGHKRKKWLLRSVSFICAVTFLFLLQRFQFVMTAVLCLTLVYYSTRRLKPAAILVSFLSVAGLFYWVSSIRTGQFIQYYLYLSSQMKYSYHYVIFTEPYMYVVMNLENFARGIEHLEHFTYGTYSFDFALALVGLKHWVHQYFSLEDTPFLNSGYNTYSAFWGFYRDFGIVGVMMLSMSFGSIVSICYYYMRRRPNILNVTFYCVLLFVMVMSFFNYPLSLLWFMYVVVVLFLILRFSFMKQNVPPSPVIV